MKCKATIEKEFVLFETFKGLANADRFIHKKIFKIQISELQYTVLFVVRQKRCKTYIRLSFTLECN